MNKIFLSVASMIVAHFALKVMRKLKHPDQVKKAEREAWLKEHQPKRPVAEVDARLMRGDPSETLASIGTVSELEAALRPCRPVDGCDAMAMAPGRFA